MNNIFTYKINKYSAGRTFPFDRVYLIKFDDRDYIEQLFRCALVLPVEDNLKKSLIHTMPQEYCLYADRRDDTIGTVKNYVADWEQFINGSDWILVIPILTKWVKEALPRYLLNEQWFKGRANLHGEPKTRIIPTLSYLQVPNNKIRPICVACPRFIEHQNGDCHLGEPICYTSLSLGVSDHFKEANDVIPAVDNIKDPIKFESEE